MGDRRSPDQRRLDDAAFKRRRRQDRARITTRDKARTIYMSDTHEEPEPKADEDMATSAEASEAADDAEHINHDETEEAAEEEPEAEEEAEEAQAADKD
jgi:hypothetical protein